MNNDQEIILAKISAVYDKPPFVKMETGQMNKKILHNQYIYSVITKIVIVAIGFLNSMILARYLGPELKGMAATAVNYANIFSIVVTFGLQEAYPFFRKEREKKKYLSEYMSFAIVLFVSYAIIAGLFIVICKPQLEVIACIVVTLIMGYATIVNYVALVEAPNKRNSAMTVMYVIDLAVLVALYLFVPQSYLIAIFLTSFVFLIINIALNAILIPQFGTNGAAVASDISYFICASLFVIYFCKVENLKLKEVILLQKSDLTFLKKV